MNEKRLLIAAEIFPPAIGGPATYAATLARELPARGWRVAVVCYSDHAAGTFTAKIISVSKRGGAVARYGRYFLALWKAAKDFPIIYAQGPVSSGLPAMVVAKLRRKKLVVKVTGDYAWEQAFRAGATAVFIEEYQRQVARGKYRVLRSIERLVCQQADRVVTPSIFLKKIVLGWGVTAKKLFVIYNAPAFPAIEGSQEQLRARFHIPADCVLAVSVGRPVPWKGFGALGRAVAELLADGRNIRLVCLGISGEQLRQMMMAAGAPPFPMDDVRIVGIGAVDKLEVLAWLHAADCFVLNTAYEGLSHIILEAMYAGVPVITTDVGGNCELVRPGETGVFVPYNDVAEIKQALAALTDKRDCYAPLAVAAVRVPQRFSMEAMLRSIEQLLVNVLAHNSVR